MVQTLASRLTSTRSITRDIVLACVGAAFTALCAQIAIPFFPVPFTLQTFAVLACGLALGARLGAASQVAYLVAGMAGLPVFTAFSGGFARIAGPTGGYLIAFVAAAYIVGLFAEKGWTQKPILAVLGSFLAMAVVYALGAAWLSVYVGFTAAIAQGVVPFLVSDALKALAAGSLLPAAEWFLGKAGK